MKSKYFLAGLVGAFAVACGLLLSVPAAKLPLISAQPAWGSSSDELIVEFTGNASAKRERRVVERRGASIEDRTKIIDAAVVKVGSSENRDNVEASLERSSVVNHAEPNQDVQVLGTPNDPYLSSQWALYKTSALEAWDLMGGSSPAVVAVSDTGAYLSHPDLNSNLWTNTGEIAGNGIDDDHNGVVDDVHGADFYNNDGDPTDDNGHGTHVAGTIGAEWNNGTGIAGMAPSVRIMPVKFISKYGWGTLWGAIQSIDYATEEGARVINASWGCYCYSQSLRNAIHNAGDAGVLFVAAAGNSNLNTDTYPHYPSSFDEPNVISVASTTSSDSRSSFSNYGPVSVDLGAPGSSIISTYLYSGYAWLSGTSMAAPHVSGAAALLWSQDPNASYSDVRTALLDSVDPISALQGLTVTGGRLNVEAALRQFMSIPLDPPPESPPESTEPPAEPPADSADPAPPAEEQYPTAFNLLKPANNKVVRASSKRRGKKGKRRRVRVRTKRVRLRWSRSKSPSGIASYTVMLDGRPVRLLTDPDGLGGSRTPKTSVRVRVKIGKHYWYVVAVDWDGNWRRNVATNGTSRQYFRVVRSKRHHKHHKKSRSSKRSHRKSSR